MSMSYKSNVVVKLAKQTIPDDIVGKVFNDTVSAVGFAIPTIIEGVEQVSIQHGDLSEQEIDFKVVQESMKELSLTTFLGSFSRPLNAENIQPFEVCKNGFDKTAAAAFLIGEFPGFEEDKSTHSPEFFFFNKYLQPKLQKLYIDSGQDIKKFSDALRQDVLHIEIDAVSGKDHQILIVCQNGAHAMFENKKPYVRAWGWVADASSFDAKPATAEPVPEVKAPITGAAALFTKKKTTATTHGADLPKAPEPAKTEPVPIEPPKTDTKIPNEIPKSMVMMPPPDWLTSNNDVRQWFERKGFTEQTRPKNWKDRPAVAVLLGELTDRERAFLKKIGEAPEPKITVTSTHVREPGDPLVSKENIAAFHADFIQKDGLGASIVNDPKKAQDEEARRQRWEDFKAGSLDILRSWTDEKLIYFVKSHPEMALIALRDALGPVQKKNTPAVETPTSGAASLFKKKSAA